MVCFLLFPRPPLATRTDTLCPDTTLVRSHACEVKLGGIDVLVNDAGVASSGFFSELSLEDCDWQIAINLMGVVKGCKAFLPLLEKSKGKIINIASMAALMQGPAMSTYNEIGRATGRERECQYV